MKHYLIEILWDDPYPKTASYRVQSSSVRPAIGKALGKFRAEYKGRRLTKGTIRFQHYATQTPETSS